jgi:hypothetical protein
MGQAGNTDGDVRVTAGREAGATSVSSGWGNGAVLAIPPFSAKDAEMDGARMQCFDAESTRRLRSNLWASACDG